MILFLVSEGGDANLSSLVFDPFVIFFLVSEGGAAYLISFVLDPLVILFLEREGLPCRPEESSPRCSEKSA